jgi:hypothetical protein
MPGERRRRYLLFFLFFLFIGAGIFWLTRMNSSDDNKQEIAGRSNTQKEETSISDVVKDHSAATKQASGVSDIKIKPSNASEAKPPPVNNQLVGASAVAPVTISRHSTSTKIKKQGSQNGRVAKGDTKNKKGNNNGVSGNEGSEINNQAGTEKKDPDVANGGDVTTKDAIPPIVASGHKKTDPQPSIDKDTKDQTVKQGQASAQKEKAGKNKVNTKWTLAATYAPDISTVNFTHLQPIGLNLGLMLEYSLSKKFSLQTGLIYTRKNYKMKGEDYHPPKGYWTDYVNLEDVTGNCSMLDIPINLRFNAVRKKSSNIFFSAGLSTYLMKEENYSFYYYWSGTPATRVRSYDANSEYLFSILNLSAGYEKKLNNSFSLQVEPFFKESLTGVGFGKIDLNSMGVYFSVRYNPLRTVKKPATAKK